MEVASSPEEPKGTTLKVYWIMLKAGRPLRVSDIQRELRLSSSSLAQYHLRKLMEMGLVGERQDGYAIERIQLKSFFRIRNTILPFQVFYVVFFGGSLVALISILALGPSKTITSFDFVAIVVNVVALLASVYEANRTVRGMP